MLKKLVTAVIAGAFATALAAPAVMACPDKESSKVVKKEKADTAKTAQKVKAKKGSKDKAKTKVVSKKVISKG